MSIIDVQGLTKTFKGRTVLSNINFNIEQGEIFGYLGPNGAGKTTTMRIILGLLMPTMGHALVWGKDLGRDDAARQRVGVLLENDGIYERLTAFENMLYYARLYGVADPKPKIKRLLDLVGLSERADDKTGKYSRGMKRKIGLARAIIHDPEVLLLDEPAAGLDPEAQKMIRDLIKHLSSEKITIFLSSHDLDEVQRICSRVAILQGGRIRVLDTLENLTRARPRLDIAISDTAQVERALALVSGLDYVEDARSDDHGITLSLKDKKLSADLIARLVTGGIMVDEARREAKSLEDVYLDIVRREEKP